MTTITSTIGNDNLNAGSGDDVMFGGAGSDKMSGGSGADVMDGGSGSDSLNGGSGKDTLIYTLAENRGATDLYMGGSGVDTVRLQFTDAEWRSTVVQNQIAYYLRHLATVKTNVNTGEVSNGTASDFTFVFDSSTRLTISMMEALDVWVDGQQFDFRAPFVASTSGLRAVIEDTGVVSGHLQTAGMITFTDTEWDQAHTVNAVPSSGNAFGGTLSAVISNAATGDGAGTVSWSYRVANSSTQHLAAGETSTESFVITIDDGHGGVAEQTVSITITGTNDAPLISLGAGDSAAASLSETNSGLSASGTLTVRDADTSDTVGSSVVQVSATGATGALTNDQLLAMLSVAPAANLAANSADAHNLTWSFDSGSEAFNYLAANESLALAYTLRSSDGHGGVAEQTVSITITGTNDAPLISLGAGDSAAASLSETNSGLSASGTLTVRDADTSDTVGSSVVQVSATGATGALTNDQLLAMLSVAPAANLAANSADAHNLTWSFDSGSEAFNYLAANESLALAYTLRSSDGHGGVAEQTVSITITGTNDAPLISLGAGDSAAASLSETNSGLSASGTLTVRDADTSDTVGSSVVQVSATGATGALTNDQLLAMLSVAPAANLAANSADAHNLTWSFDSGSEAFNYLAANESLALAYTLRSSDGHGGVAEQTVSITITGTNDAPLISLGAGDSAAASLSETNSGLSASGTLTVRDADTSDTVGSSVVQVSATGATGALTNDQLLAMLSVAPAANLAANSADAHNLTWSFDSGSEAFNYLAANESLALAYTLRSSDGHGGVAEQTVSITITGTNDAPLISLGAGDSAAASLSETNSGLSASGTLTVRDADTSDTVGSSVVQVSATGATGALTNDQLLAMLSVAPAANLAANSADAHNLTWSFDSGSEAFNYLAANESLALAYTLRSSDGHGGVAEQTVSITITGTNDVTPDILLTVSGAPGNSLPNGLFGQLTAISDDSGAHTYSLVSLTATTLTGAAAPNFAGDLSISSGGSLSAANLDDNRIYSMQVQAQQGTATFIKAFSIITGTNVGNNLNGAGDDVIYGQSGNDVILAGSGADSVFGQGGDDTINGGLGNDTLTGGGNNDTFVFDTSLDAINNVDTITDFNANSGDQIQLDQTIFSALTVGTSVNANHFRANAGGSAVDANDHILYDIATGNLYYDADGNGAGLKALFATLHGSSGTLDSSDFSVTA